MIVAMLESGASLNCGSPYFHQALHMEAVHLLQSTAAPYVCVLLYQMGELDHELWKQHHDKEARLPRDC